MIKFLFKTIEYAYIKVFFKIYAEGCAYFGSFVRIYAFYPPLAAGRRVGDLRIGPPLCIAKKT
ncbi:hypothetical protein D1155_12140 [Anaerotruncus sp. 80]|uniref:Uncharacterized protein n=1 Tax=Anaerotruncus colihominis TaxID=169435 RepID=A0A845QKK3_9FIRM|nr:hypothetical protein [Anaerotruncus colihominis]NCF03054.1 hypothetical protein [Anaerotruncus sp. 80]